MPYAMTSAFEKIPRFLHQRKSCSSFDKNLSGLSIVSIVFTSPKPIHLAQMIQPHKAKKKYTTNKNDWAYKRFRKSITAQHAFVNIHTRNPAGSLCTFKTTPKIDRPASIHITSSLNSLGSLPNGRLASTSLRRLYRLKFL